MPPRTLPTKGNTPFETPGRGFKFSQRKILEVFIRRRKEEAAPMSRRHEQARFLEREKGFEPSTLALARRCSTTELFPLEMDCQERGRILLMGCSAVKQLASADISFPLVT